MSRSIPRGQSRWFACRDIVNPAAPTRAELTAGLEITQSIAAIGGFALTNSPVPTPDLGSRRDSKVPGTDNVGDLSLNLWDEIARGTTTSDPARDALAKDTELYLVIMPYGDVPGRRCEVWQVTSTGVNDQRDMSAAMQYQIGFADGDVLEQDAVIPAA
jgi:hypothetical protein